MDELKIGSLLAEQGKMAEYAAALPFGMPEFPVPDDVKRKMEAEAKARHEKQAKRQRAAMVVDLAQALMLSGTDNSVVCMDPNFAISQAEKFVAAAEKYLAEKGE